MRDSLADGQNQTTELVLRKKKRNRSTTPTNYEPTEFDISYLIIKSARRSEGAVKQNIFRPLSNRADPHPVGWNDVISFQRDPKVNVQLSLIGGQR